MSIKELLAKVNKETQNEVLTTEQVKNKSFVSLMSPEKQDENRIVSQDTEKLRNVKVSELSFTDLLEHYSQLRSWLETHECQTGTNNELDVNDRPYDSKQYVKKLEELENIVCEIFARPVTDGLEEQLKKYGL